MTDKTQSHAPETTKPGEVKLEYPVTHEKMEYATLMMRRPKVKDQLLSDKTPGSDADKEQALFANLCDVAPGVIGELDLADYLELQEVYSDFLSSRKKKPGGSA